MMALWDESSPAEFQSGLSKRGGDHRDRREAHSSTSSSLTLPLSSTPHCPHPSFSCHSHPFTFTLTPSPGAHPSSLHWLSEGRTYSPESEVKRFHSTGWQRDLTRASDDQSLQSDASWSSGKRCSFQVVKVWIWLRNLYQNLVECTSLLHNRPPIWFHPGGGCIYCSWAWTTEGTIIQDGKCFTWTRWSLMTDGFDWLQASWFPRTNNNKQHSAKTVIPPVQHEKIKNMLEMNLSRQQMCNSSSRSTNSSQIWLVVILCRWPVICIQRYTKNPQQKVTHKATLYLA